MNSNSTTFTQNAAECISLSFLSYFSKFSLLLCSECRVALFSDTFSSHVKSHYKQHAEKEKQRELLSQISSLSLFTAAETFALIQQLSMTLSAFSELDVHKNAFSCNLCHLVLLNKENMKRHCSKNHASDFKHTVTSSVTAQSLHKRRFFFQVQARSLSTVSNVASDIQSIESDNDNDLQSDLAVSTLLSSYEKKVEKIQAKSEIIDLKHTREELSAFQIQTQYLNFLNRRNYSFVNTFVQSADKTSEHILFALSLQIKQLLQKSLSQVQYMSRQHLNMLNSFELNNIRIKSFKATQNLSTINKYAKVFAQFFCFLFRTASITNKELSFTSAIELASSKDEKRSLKKLFRLSDKSQALINDLHEFVESDEVDILFVEEETKKKKNKRKQVSRSSLSSSDSDSSTTESSSSFNNISDSSFSDTDESESNDEETTVTERRKNDSSSSESDSSNDDSNTNFDKKLLSYKLNKVQSLLLDLFVSLLQQNIEFNKFDSCINSFFACYSVNVRTKSLKDSAQMSQSYSAFIYCAQLLTLEHCTQQYLQKRNEQINCSLLTELSLFMNTFFHNTAVTALAEILNLRAYAFKVNKNSSSALNQIIVHNNELISCKENTVSLFDMKHLFKQLTLKTHEILFSELLFNADVTDFSALTLSALAATENLADNTAHTYFFSHNTTLSHFSSYLQNKVLANRTLREQMFFMKRNKLMFKTKSVSNYIESLKRFLLHL